MTKINREENKLYQEVQSHYRTFLENKIKPHINKSNFNVTDEIKTPPFYIAPNRVG